MKRQLGPEQVMEQKLKEYFRFLFPKQLVKPTSLISFFITGSIHPMLTIAHTSYSCHDVLEKKSTDSSPSHSQMSRNSSRKSNNSLLVNNGKLEGKILLLKFNQI